MSLKYRIRLKNDRVIGPFTSEEVAELFFKKHIDGHELCQQFPIGDWRKITTFPTLLSLIEEIRKNNLTTTPSEKNLINSPSTYQKEKSSITKNVNSSLKLFNEFKFGKSAKVDVDYDALEKKYQEVDRKENNNDIEKTKVISKLANKKFQELEKTLVVASQASWKNKEGTDSLNRDSIALTADKALTTKEISNVASLEELMNEKTEFFNIEKVLPTINAQLSISEIELDNQARIEENQEKIRQKLQLEYNQQLALIDDREQLETGSEIYEIQDYVEDQSSNNFQQFRLPKKEKLKKRKSMSIIVALAFLGIFYLLMSEDEKPKEVGPKFLDIKFPKTQEYENKVAANQALVLGRTYYAKGNYKNRAIASMYFVKSLESQFRANEALGELILVYSELLNDSKDPVRAANTVYTLIQISENKMLYDLNTVTGAAMFYGRIGKYLTGANVVENYLRANGQPSSKLLAYYMDLLISAGDLVKARKVFNRLKLISKKPFEVYYYLTKFYEVNNQQAEARLVIEEGLKYYPESVLLLLKYADYLFKDQSPKKYEDVLKKCCKNNSEDSPVLMAKFYQHMGLLSASKKKNKEASIYFKKSLALIESEELRTMLSSLEISGDKLSQSLILESKVIDLIKRAKEEIKNKNLESAFSFSMEAVDGAPNFIPAILLQVQLQQYRGLFNSAINTLQNAIAQNPTSLALRKTLVTTYLKAFKFYEADKMLVELAQTKFAIGSEYASLMGDLALAKGQTIIAMKWYAEALSRDPLSDNDMYKLAKIYVRIKKFDDGKKMLLKAITLDPKNTDYLTLYSEIIFEQDNTETAIGYLRDLISEMGEEPKLISAIATYYFKTGQEKEFQNYYKRIQDMPKKDESFYEFLMNSSRLEDRKDDYIKYARELLKINPGNLKIKIELGEYLFNLKKYQEAQVEFDEIREKLESYPKVHFLLAKLFLATGEIEKAKKMAQKELDLNPTLDSAYFIMGEVAKEEKNYREAVLKYEKAISLNSKSVEALMALAWIRLSQNYASEAIELYARALSEDKNNPEIYKQLGNAYRAAGQRALAKEKFEEYLKINPGAPDKESIEVLIRNLQ